MSVTPHKINKVTAFQHHADSKTDSSEDEEQGIAAEDLPNGGQRFSRRVSYTQELSSNQATDKLTRVFQAPKHVNAQIRIMFSGKFTLMRSLSRLSDSVAMLWKI